MFAQVFFGQRDNFKTIIISSIVIVVGFILIFISSKIRIANEN